MESFEKNIEDLRKLDLPREKFAVFGSGPMAVHGIRDSADLDIIVLPELWNELSKKYPAKDEREIRVKEISFFNSWRPWFEDVSKLIKDCEIIDGIRFVKLKYVIEWKKKFNREKDRRDMKLIEEYFERVKRFSAGDTAVEKFEKEIGQVCNLKIKLEEKISKIDEILREAIGPWSLKGDDRVLSMIKNSTSDFISRIVRAEILAAKSEEELENIKKIVDGISWLAERFKSGLRVYLSFRKFEIIRKNV